jgi:hypothetical protein
MNKKKKQLQWAINPATGQMMVREIEPKKRGRMKLVMNKDGLEMILPRQRELDEKIQKAKEDFEGLFNEQPSYE